MGKVLAEYQSNSNPGKVYHVIRGNDGVTYCDCPAWRFHRERTCRHLEDYLNNQKVFNSFYQGKMYTADTEAELRKAIDAAVGELA